MSTIITILATLLAVIIGALQWQLCLDTGGLYGYSGVFVHMLLVGTLCCLVHILARRS